MTTSSSSQSSSTLCNFVNSELGKLDFESEDSLSDEDNNEVILDGYVFLLLILF